jgi:hypothetical protein
LRPEMRRGWETYLWTMALARFETIEVEDNSRMPESVEIIELFTEVLFTEARKTQ